MHDGEVAGVIDRKQYVRHADRSEVAAFRRILECVGKELVTLRGQGCEDTLPAAEVMSWRGVTDA